MRFFIRSCPLRVFILLSLLSGIPSFASTTTTLQQTDPSLVPIWEDGVAVERYRIVADINQDGEPDLILSGNIREFGTGGGHFIVYLKENGAYRQIGYIFAHPLAIALEHNANYRDSHKLWIYFRSSSNSGSLGYNTIIDSKLSDFNSVEITLSPTGSTIGDRLYKNIFSAPFLLEPEVSSTTEGNVSWKRMKD